MLEKMKVPEVSFSRKVFYFEYLSLPRRGKMGHLRHSLLHVSHSRGKAFLEKALESVHFSCYHSLFSFPSLSTSYLQDCSWFIHYLFWYEQLKKVDT